MLYFSAAPVRPDSVDEHQFRSLQEFKTSCRERGLIHLPQLLDPFGDGPHADAHTRRNRLIRLVRQRPLHQAGRHTGVVLALRWSFIRSLL